MTWTSEAYLDNYEFLEGPIGAVDSDMMLSIENDMREELRNMDSRRCFL